MRLPSHRAAIAIYAGLLALSTINRLIAPGHPLPHWALIALSVPYVLTPAALFVAAFVIIDRYAVVLPVAGELGQALVIHYFKSEPTGYRASGIAEMHLPHELWGTIKFDVLVGLLVVAAALWLARTAWPRVADDPPRIEFPRPEFPTIAFAAVLIANTVMDVLELRAGFHGYAASLLTLALASALSISYFLVNVTAYSAWVAPLPVFVAFQSFIAVAVQPGFDCSPTSQCSTYIWPLMRDLLIVYACVSVASLAAAWWARRAETPTLT